MNQEKDMRNLCFKKKKIVNDLILEKTCKNLV